MFLLELGGMDEYLHILYKKGEGLGNNYRQNPPKIAGLFDVSVLDGFGNKKYNDRNLSIFTRAVGLPAALKWKYIPIRLIPRGVDGERSLTWRITSWTSASIREH